MRYAVLLRGVNVGGRTVRMADLRAALATLPVRDVRTLLASGNVVCRFDGPAVELRTLVEARLREAFGYEAWVVVLDAARLDALLAVCPYPADDPTTHTYVTVTSDPAVLDALDAAVLEVDPAAPQVRLGPEATAWTVTAGATLGAVRSRLASRVRYAPSITDRNLRTMHAVQGALAAMGGDAAG